MEWMSVADASRALHLSEQHIRRLASSGALAAHRLPGGWLVAEQAVRERAHSAPPSAGRPLSEAMSWLVLRALNENIESSPDPDAAPVPVLARIDDRKVRYRLRKLLADAPQLEQWPSWLRHRGELKRVWVHPGVLARLAEDDRLRAGGGGTAACIAIGITASEQRRFYIRKADFPAVMEQYRAREVPDGQVELLLIPSAICDGPPPDASPVPLALVLLDLLESPDARAHRAASEVLSAAVSRLAAQP
jgi:hypothetical protein